ncbi:hypothetical protein [Gordonia neofelifaecis]|uniref:Integral membrane protein n=1 Tax=Gordonia neofelifaecis NRRL B-59395 TaxID=644548 RepID=F1YN05_9ACTN|nr:hypothetical protein [Gordonia neofelifaecis]EGD53892.1 hypothetical protein SCNU_16563 [Gordonia neofelifaecis NRRL B-59395]
MTALAVRVDAFTACGAAFVVAGGLVGAVTGPLDLAKGSWLAAYLVLVCGVALIVIGAAQQRLDAPVPAQLQVLQLTGWLVANVVVVLGSLSSSTVIVDVGAVLLLIVLATTWWIGRTLARRRTLAAYAYLAILAILIVSAPVGMGLAAH